MMSNRSNRWAEHTLSGLASVARELSQQETWAAPERGFLQRMPASLKWCLTLTLLMGLGLLANLGLLALALCGILALGQGSGVPLRVLVQRVLPLCLPLLTLLGFTLVLRSHGGELGAARSALRALDSLLLTLLLVLTTKRSALFAGLRRLGIPSLFIVLLEQTQCHLFQLPQSAEEMFQARRARTLRALPTKENQQFVGRSIGALLGKTQARSETRYAAMRARGYGQLRNQNHDV